MNPLLKAFLKEAADIVAAGRAAIGSDWSKLFGALVQAGEDVPAIISNWADLKPELEALMSNPAADADLLAYATALVTGEGAKAEALIVASADLILTGAQKVEALLKAIQMPSTPPAA